MTDPHLKPPTPIRETPPIAERVAHASSRSRKWLTAQPRWALVAVPSALLIGLTFGAVAIPDSDPRETDEYLALRDRTSTELENMRDRADERQDKIGELTRDLRAFQNRRDDLDEAEEAAAVREAELAAIEAELAAREEAVGAAETAAKANQFENGINLVGTDIQAGTYRSEGGGSCYWARLSGLGGSIGEILSNGIADGQAVVTISASDAAFESRGCSTWTRIG